MPIRRNLVKLGHKAYLRGKSIYAQGRAGYKRSKSAPGQKSLFETKTEKRFEAFFKKSSSRGEDVLLLGGGITAGVVADDWLDRRRLKRQRQKYYKQSKRR